MSRPELAKPTLCLNMIVRNEAHIVHEVLDAVGPYISSWVIVDTGSEDGTQDLIRGHMASLGIPGELYERPWRNFGHNRSEALKLAQGHADYIWVIDADDTVAGTPDFTRLSADVYDLRIRDEGTHNIHWRRQLFRDGVGWYYLGVVHEFSTCDHPYVTQRLEGDYYVESRRLGSRNRDPQKYERDRDVLLAELDRNPDDKRSMISLAQTYFDLKDFAKARRWAARRAQLGDGDEEVYFCMYLVAESMSKLGEPWPEVQDAFLRAWEFRPTRAETLYEIAFRYRADERYHLGHLFAKRAAEIPIPAEDSSFVRTQIYNWRAADEQAVCASWIDKHEESFAICRRLLARDDLPDADRKRIAENRDIVAPTMLDAVAAYPGKLARDVVAGPRDCELTISLVAGPDRSATERTLNSFLGCCLELPRMVRVLVVNAGLSEQDRTTLLQRYQFIEFGGSAYEEGPDVGLAHIRDEIQGRFWLHLGQGWRFFAPERFIGRLTAILEAEPEVFQVGINFGDARELTGASAADDLVRRTADAGRYVIRDVVASGPAMFETTRLDRAHGFIRTDGDPIAELGRRARAAGLRTASLDEVLCIAGADCRSTD
jgi:glycosyltransferase involved in cell wall biosynthesis